MTDFATLALRVDNAQAVKALDETGNATDQLSAKTKNMSVTTEGARKAWAAAGGDMTKFGRELQKMLGVTDQAEKSVNRYADAIKRMKDAAQQSQANAMASMIKASDPFQAGAMAKAAEVAPKAAFSFQKLQGAMQTLAFTSAALPGSLGRIGSVLGSFAVGSGAMVAVLAGLAALAFAWEKISEGAKKAEEAQQGAVSSATGLRSQQRNPILGDVPAQQTLLEQRKTDLTADLENAEKMSARFGGTTNNLGLLTRLIYGDPAKIKRELGDVNNLIQATTKEISRLKAVANEPTRQAGLQSQGNILDIALGREQVRSQIALNPRFLTSKTEKSDLDLALQASAAKLAATKRQIDEQFRLVDAEGKEKPLLAEQQAAKDKLIKQAVELNGLADRQLRMETALAREVNKAQQLVESDSPRDRLKGRLQMIEIEKRAEIQKTGDVETAQLRADQKVHQARMQQVQEVMQKIQSYYETFVSPLLQLDASGRGGKVASVGSSVMNSAMQGFAVSGGNPIGAAAGAVIGLTTSIISLGRASKQAAEAQAAAQKEFQYSFALYKKGAYGTVTDLDQSLEAERQRYNQIEQEIQTVYGGKKNEAERERLLDQAKKAHDMYVNNIKATAVEMEKAAKADGLRKLISDLTNTIGNLAEFKGSLSLSELSPLSPMQKLAEARRQYEEILGKAKGGSQDAANQLPQFAQAFLSASRNVNASGAAYQRDFARVVADTDAVMKLFEAQRAIAQQQLDVLMGIRDGSVESTTQIVDAIVSVKTTIQDLIDETKTNGQTVELAI